MTRSSGAPAARRRGSTDVRSKCLLLVCAAALVFPGAAASAASSSNPSSLKARFLTANDLPPGWAPSSSSSSSSSGEPPKCFAGLSSSNNHNPQVSFQKGENGPQFSEALVAAKGKAAQMLATFASAMNGCGTFHYSSEGMTATVTITPMKLARVGDKSTGFNMVVSVSIITLPVYILVSEVKNNTLALFAYSNFGQSSGSSDPLVRLAKDGMAKLQGKKSPDYSSNSPKAVGQSVRYDDGQGHTATVTLVRVIDPAQPANQYEAPDSGNRYVAAEFKIVNTGAAFQPSPTSNATAFDSASHSFNTGYADISGCPSFASNLTLNPGDVADGCVVFQVPSSAQITKIEYVEQEGAGTGVWAVQPGSSST
jgi:hypothetical protein